MFKNTRVLLDTQTFVDLAQNGLDNVSARVRKVVSDEETDILLSAISVTEIAIKAGIGKLVFSRKDIAAGLQQLRLTYIPYTANHASRMFELQKVDGHKDTFDRMLVATALAENVPLISCDTQLKRYKGLKVIQ